MKRYNDLFERVVSFENLYEANKEARQGRRSKPEILRTGEHIEEILKGLQTRLINGTWTSDPYYQFECRTEVKRRIIHAPSFRDRIFHHALIRQVREQFEKKFIFDSYACRKGKGTHKAMQRTQEFLRRAARRGEKVYILQCDISKYYPSMDHAFLKGQIRRTIADERVLRAWDALIDGFETAPGKGLPIGALTSQISANVYLNYLDHIIKERLRVKYYLRYMDDFLIIENDKRKLHRILREVQRIVEGEMNLKLNPKTRIYAASKGVDFAGYRIFTTHILPRKRNIKAAKIRFKNLSYKYKWGRASLEDAQTRVASFLGYVKHCQSHNTTKSTLKWLKLRRN